MDDPCMDNCMASPGYVRPTDKLNSFEHILFTSALLFFIENVSEME